MKYKQQKITNLQLIKKNSNNFYCYNDINFLSKLNHKNNNLVFVFHAAHKKCGENRITFRGFDWTIKNTDIVCISDRLITNYNELILSWYLSTSKYNNNNLYAEIIKYFINLKKYKKILFSGTSGGGYPALYYAAYFKQIAVIGNVQVYLEKYKHFSKLVQILEKNDDKLVYFGNDIEKCLIKSQPSNIIWYINTKDFHHYHHHHKPLVKFLKDNNYNNLLDIRLFKSPDILPPKKCHHHIHYPDNKKHCKILDEIINYEKIFVIGFNKCATTTIHHLFKQNNLSSYHQGVKYKIRKWTDVFDKYKCFSDIGFTIDIIKNLNKTNPNSLFILNTRKLNKWIISRFEHGVRGYLKNGKHCYYPFSEDQMIHWIKLRENYYKEVLEYFKNTPDKLLIINIEKHNWENYVKEKLNFKIKIKNSKNIKKKSKEYSSICNSVNKTFDKLGYSIDKQNQLLVDGEYLNIYNNNFS